MVALAAVIAMTAVHRAMGSHTAELVHGEEHIAVATQLAFLDGKDGSSARDAPTLSADSSTHSADDHSHHPDCATNVDRSVVALSLPSVQQEFPRVLASTWPFLLERPPRQI